MKAFFWLPKASCKLSNPRAQRLHWYPLAAILVVLVIASALPAKAEVVYTPVNVTIRGNGSVCCELTRRGLRVIGFDRFIPTHGRGSHSGDTRVFRMAYAEHPDYVPLALRASELWDEYADLGKVRLLTRCGVLGIGSPDSSLIAGIRRSALIHRLEVVQHSSEDIKREFPAFAPDEGHIGLLEPKAGWIDSNAAIGTALQIAKLNGATLRLANPVSNWAYDQGSFEITTVSDRVVAKRLVITAGAWSAQFLQQLGLPLTLQRKVLTWIDPIEPRLFQPGAFPVFVSSEGFLYGFPALGEQGVKLAVHWTPGQTVVDPNEPVPEAILDDAGEPLAIASRLLPQLAGRLPDALQRVKRMKTCLYVMSPDEHFFVDRHPEWPGLVFAAGFSGHGFKFAPVIGEILADMATSSVMKLQIDFLRIARLSRSSENQEGMRQKSMR